MADGNELTITVGAEADTSGVQSQTKKILQIFNKVMTDLETQGGSSAKKVRAELASIRDAFLQGGLSTTDVVGVENILNGLIEARDAAGAVAVSVTDVHRALREAAEGSERLGSHIRTIEEDLPSGSAMDEASQGLGALSDDFASLSQQVGSLGEGFKRVFQGFKVSPIKVGILAVAAAVVAVVKGVLSWRNEMRKLNAAQTERTIEDQEIKKNRYYEQRLDTMRRMADLQQEMRNNARAEIDAIHDLTEATAELEAAKRKAGALSMAERNKVEQDLLEAKNRTSGARSIEEIDRAEEDERKRLELIRKEIEVAKEREEQARLNRDVAASKEEFHYSQTSEGVRRAGGAVGGAAHQITDMIGYTDSDFQAQQHSYWRGRRQSLEEEMYSAQKEQKEKEAQAQAIQARLDGEYFKKKREAARRKIAAAEAEARTAKEEQEREARYTAERREYELDDRRRDFSDIKDEEKFRQMEASRGHAGREAANMARYNLVDRRLDEARSRLDEAEKEEAERTGKKFSELEESELSDIFKEKRSREQAKIWRYEEEKVRLGGQAFDIRREGDERTAEVLAQSMKGGSRLTAMGLGGGDSPQKETAKNTRKLVSEFGYIRKMLESGDTKLLSAGQLSMRSRRPAWAE